MTDSEKVNPVWKGDKKRQKCTSDLKGATVLIVDDEENIRNLLLRSLKPCVGHVEEAVNGQHGLQKLLHGTFDLLIVDIRMSKMDGLTFLDEALNIWPWLGVVVITGYCNADIRNKLNRMNVSRILNKPFEINELKNELAAEYLRLSEETNSQRVLPLARVQQQLQILRLITEPALKIDTFNGALRRLNEKLSNFLDFSVVGLLAIADQPLVTFHISQPVSQIFLNSLLEKTKERYTALSGESLSEPIRVEVEGQEENAKGFDKAVFSFFVPIMSENRIQGLLILAAGEKIDYDAAELSFVYHAANHLSTVFTALSRMRELATHDSLTQLYNRRYLESQLYHHWERIKRYGGKISVVMIDIDYFKNINDSLGHVQGDEILKEFARIITDEARAADIVGRYGGEEFVAVLPATGNDESLVYGERLLDSIRGHVFCPGVYDISLTASIGISSFEGSCEEGVAFNPLQLLEYADSAMYFAKRSGRNCIRSWRKENSPYPEIHSDENGKQNGRNFFKHGKSLIKNILQLETRQCQQYINQLSLDKNRQINETSEKIENSYSNTLAALAGIIDVRENNNIEHSKRVRDLTVAFARKLGINGKDLKTIQKGAVLHDIGKIGVPDRVLLKPAELTQEEWDIVKKHPYIGYYLLAVNIYMQEVASLVYEHQERYDGTGYPRGLKGTEINRNARIFAVIDAYDCMRSDKVYKSAVSAREAVSEIERQKGLQFDPDIVDSFLACQDEVHILFESWENENKAINLP